MSGEIHGPGPKRRLDAVIYDLISKRYALNQVYGVQEPSSERQTDDYDERSSGTSGIAYQESIFKNYTFSADIRTWRSDMNAIDAILQDQNPGFADSEAVGDPLILLGGAMNLSKEINIMCHLLSKDRIKVTAGRMVFCGSKIKFGAKGSFTGDITVPFAIEAKRVYSANKQPFADFWQHNCRVVQQETPDNTVQIGAGSVALRRNTMTGIRPLLKPIKMQSSEAFSICASDSRKDALIAYESGSGYNDVALLIVEGTPGASPTAPLDTDIETEVDGENTGARWCRLADITVDEPSTVIVNTADIEIPAKSTFTLSNTALSVNLIDEDYTEDNIIMHDYLMAVFLDGVLKENMVGINKASCNATTLAFTGPQSGLIAGWYWKDIGDYIT